VDLVADLAKLEKLNERNTIKKATDLQQDKTQILIDDINTALYRKLAEI
jgi:hypothetical protein